MVRTLGADIVIDYRKESFETKLADYDLVVCGLEGEALTKSLKVLKPGGRLISLAGPPTPDFARKQGLSWPLQQVMRLLSFDIRRKARARGIQYEFLFMRADGGQLAQLGALVESGTIRPVIDRVFPFAQTNEAFDYLDTGHAKGKVVVAVTSDDHQ
jgi:NADPH:quinone reductase-like Zn-dependent oxidoreductase